MMMWVSMQQLNASRIHEGYRSSLEHAVVVDDKSLVTLRRGED